MLDQIKQIWMNLASKIFVKKEFTLYYFNMIFARWTREQLRGMLTCSRRLWFNPR